MWSETYNTSSLDETSTVLDMGPTLLQSDLIFFFLFVFLVVHAWHSQARG